jgi:hypothetical protein
MAPHRGVTPSFTALSISSSGDQFLGMSQIVPKLCFQGTTEEIQHMQEFGIPVSEVLTAILDALYSAQEKQHKGETSI